MTCSSSFNDIYANSMRAVKDCCFAKMRTKGCKPPMSHMNYLSYFLLKYDGMLTLLFIAIIACIIAIMLAKEDDREGQTEQYSLLHRGECLCWWIRLGPERLCTKIICCFLKFLRKLTTFLPAVSEHWRDSDEIGLGV
ncbi:uncharacterized protein LOC106670806 [Cimex lectularius]|uniref:Uncharacterized protein n=1 Tax=Cimex lectularius TaxID=79782 RepID=A0A8I6S4Z5_CIMLE|nr:uncharacterized protein LOC106670806 [Cimex lectularius]